MGDYATPAPHPAKQHLNQLFHNVHRVVQVLYTITPHLSSSTPPLSRYGSVPHIILTLRSPTPRVHPAGTPDKEGAGLLVPSSGDILAWTPAEFWEPSAWRGRWAH